MSVHAQELKHREDQIRALQIEKEGLERSVKEYQSRADSGVVAAAAQQQFDVLSSTITQCKETIAALQSQLQSTQEELDTTKFNNKGYQDQLQRMTTELESVMEVKDREIVAKASR